MLKNLRVVLIVLLLVSFFAGTASALEVIFKDVTINDDGVVTRYRTASDTLEEFLKSEDIQIYEKDIVSEDLDTIIPDFIDITIDRAFYVNANLDGKTEKIKMEKNSAIGNLIKIFQDTTGIEYVYTDGYYADKLYENQEVILKSKVVTVITVSESIPFESEVVLSDTLEKDKETLKQLGVEGTKEVTTEIILLGGVEDSRKVLSDVVITEPINKIVTKGTYVKPEEPVNVVVTEKGDFKYKKVLTMNATAYTAGYESTGKNPGDSGYGVTASGRRAQYGVVAVDPRVIPLGTNLYIEGYGYSVAGDTGGAIKGNKIDLFYDSLSTANNFGRRNVTVYVLD